MKLGVYRPPSDESDAYERVALYDFDAGEWDDSSDGVIVSKASRDPSPEELKVRFDLESRRTIVATPQQLAADNATVEVADQTMTVEEGHEYRDEQGGPLLTQTEREYRRDQGVRVFPDDHDISDEDREWHADRGEDVVHESDFDDLVFADEFDFDFHTGDETADEPVSTAE